MSRIGHDSDLCFVECRLYRVVVVVVVMSGTDRSGQREGHSDGSNGSPVGTRCDESVSSGS